MPLYFLLLLGVSCALPANDTLMAGTQAQSLRPRTQMKFDIDDMHEDCFGVRMRSLGSALGTPSATKPGYRDQVGPPECERFADSKARTGLYYTPLPPAVKSTTKMPKDTSLLWKSEKDVRAANTLSSGAYTCDHVLEISMVLDVLHAPGGVCETAKAKRDAGASDNAKQAIERDMQRYIMQIRDIVNSKPNLIFFQGRIEDIKTENKKNFNKNNHRRAGPNDMDYMAVADYLLRKTSVQSVADRIDAKIEQLFGADVAKAASMADYWRDYIRFTRAVENDVEQSIKHQVKKKIQEEDEAQKAQEQCAPKPGPGGPWGQPRPPWGKPASRKARSTLDSSGHSVSRRNQLRQYLHRRAPAVRGASRSGPHAPPARACPLPGHQPKPIVPRSKMQTRPAPAQRPRVPTQKPPIKAARPRKVVPRPANRPRRAIGKPAPPKKRVTPKKQPKRAPKPPNKPKGKPRPRKRK